MNMNLKPKSRAALSLLLALLLSICVGASAAADAGSPSSLPGEPTPLEDTVHVALLQGFGISDPETAVHVKNVDEFLAALGSDRDILLAEGCYDLSTASDYGRDYADGPYTWREVYAADGEADGGSFELVIRDVHNLNIAGDTDDIRRVVLQAVPRYANVLCFENCQVTLGALTAGHTEAPGICAGGVLQLTGCSDCTVWSSRLYGCGVLGVEAQSCRKLRLLCDEIYDCSNGAVWARTCRDVRVENCSVHSCGLSYGSAYALFSASSTSGFQLVNSRVEKNSCSTLLSSSYSEAVHLLGCSFVSNDVATAALSIRGAAPVVDACAFENRGAGGVFEINYSLGYADYALSPDGAVLSGSALLAMERAPREAVEIELPEVSADDGAAGDEYHVSTVDEFLAAIGSDRTIYLDDGLFDLSTATRCGAGFGAHYRWDERYDGPSLVIENVSNLRIVGQGQGETTLQAVPRYADVLGFEGCRNVTVADLTAGHRKEAPGSCSGDVLAFERCSGFQVADCGLFGCGVFGLRSVDSVSGELLRCEIYECSYAAASISSSDGIVFTDCAVRDCEENAVIIYDSANCEYNGTALQNGTNAVA